MNFFQNNLKKIQLFRYLNIMTFFSCPTCRKIFSLNSQGIKSFSRNYDLESAIEELKKVAAQFKRLID